MILESKKMNYKVYGLKNYVWEKLDELENEEDIPKFIANIKGNYTKVLVVSYDVQNNFDSIYFLKELDLDNSYKRKRNKKR